MCMRRIFSKKAFKQRTNVCHRLSSTHVKPRWLYRPSVPVENRSFVLPSRVYTTSNEVVIAPPVIHVTRFNLKGHFYSEVVRKSEMLSEYKLQPRDIRFSTQSSLYLRQDSIIVRMQHIKAIINCDSIILIDSDNPCIIDYVPELQERLQNNSEVLPYEFCALEAVLMKMFSVLDDRLSSLNPSIVNVLNVLLDPRLFSVDRGQLFILLHHSKSLSEFHSLVSDIEATLTDILDCEDDLTDMYLSHYRQTGEYRDSEDIEEISNILEGYLMQAENLLSRIQQLKDLIDQSESIILINLDSQRNVMMKLSLQLEMGMFSCTICGLMGLAFGMNLDSSLENNVYAFWLVTGLMIASSGLLWRQLLTFLGRKVSR